MNSKTQEPLTPENFDSANHQIIDSTPIGFGATGKVYRAANTASGEIVCVKLDDPTQKTKEKRKHRRLTPGDTVTKESGFSGRHLIQSRPYLTREGKPYSEMPLLEGDLKTYLQPNPEERLSFEKGISAAQTIQFLRDLTEGVVEQHTLRGKTHGDIKPANILRTRFAEDSGLIRLMLADCGNASYLESPTTDPRDNLGDVAFRAKELFKTESHPTIESDFYSAGAAMYQIVTGRLPLENILNQSKSPEEFIRSTSSSELRGYLRAEISEHCPRHFRNLFYVLLDPDREFRPKSDKEFQRLVEKAISRHKKSQLLSRLKRWGAIALTSIAILGAGVWQYDN